MVAREVFDQCLTMKTYKDLNGWFSFEPFYKKISETFITNDMCILEMGVFDGKSLCFMADQVKRKKLQVKIFAVDHWVADEDYARFKNNLRECDLEHFVTVIRMKSNKAAILFPDKYFDFIFIDGAHDYESVMEDLNLWIPKLKNGGIIGGDDYDPCWSGVVKAVDEKFGNSVKKQWPAWYVNL